MDKQKELIYDISKVIDSVERIDGNSFKIEIEALKREIPSVSDKEMIKKVLKDIVKKLQRFKNVEQYDGIVDFSMPSPQSIAELEIEIATIIDRIDH